MDEITILIIEDDEDIRESVKILLSPVCHPSTHQTNGIHG